MAHVEKFGRAASGHMFKHYERAKDENGEYIKFSNQDIDATRTHLNYNLAPERDINQGDIIRQRCSSPEVHENKRKDLNVMCSWVITLPQELPVTEHRQFMENAYKFMVNRYGEENVVSAHVHVDEVRPHMHFAFVPIVEDKKHGGYKVSAKDSVNRYDLQTFHKDLDAYMEREYGRNIGILNEATREGNKSIEELKRGTATEKLQDVQQRAAEAQQELQEVKQEATRYKVFRDEMLTQHGKLYEEVQQMREERTTITQEVHAAKKELQHVRESVPELRIEYDARKAFIDESVKTSEVSMMYPRYAEVTTKGLIKKQEFVTVPKEMWEAKHVSANQISAIQKEREALDKRIKTMRESMPEKKIASLEKELGETKNQLHDLRRQSKENSEQFEKVWSVFERKPEILEAVQETLKEMAKEHSRSIGRER